MTTKKDEIIVPETDNHERILELFHEPKLIGVIGDRNSGKSNLLYWIIQELRDNHDFKLYYFGLRAHLNKAIRIFTTQELEVITDSVVLIDEFATMFDVEDRRQKKEIENTLRLINHNNNVILLCGLPENYRKFLASKLDAMIFKQCAIADAINGSMVKKRIVAYGGSERGSAMLALRPEHAIVYNGEHYFKVNVPYISAGDTKAHNADILIKRTEKRTQKRS